MKAFRKHLRLHTVGLHILLGYPSDLRVYVYDLCIFLSTLLGSVADINNAIAEVNIVADTTASSMAQALSALAGFVGGS